MKKFLFCLFAAVGVLASFAADVNRKRDVVYYYYDSNPVLWPKSVPYSPEELIRRTSLDESMSANNPRPPYQSYNIEVVLPQYESAVYDNVPIFDGITAIQQANLVPLPEAGYGGNFTLNDARPIDGNAKTP